MRKINNPLLSQLFTETSFAPRKEHLRQIDAAENLYRIVDVDKFYPFEFVCFRITGYRPKHENPEIMISGADLIDALPRFILQASGRAKLITAQQNQKIYTINEVAKKLIISGRTIDRWRKKGLIGRKYIFDDGISRTGFSESTLNEFVNRNSQLVEKAAKFSNLSNKQRDEIIELIITTAKDSSLSRQQIIETVAAKSNRAVETVRYTLADYEKMYPKKITFAKPHIIIGPRERAIIYNMFEAGTSVDELAEKFCRSKSSIYRMISKRRIRKLRSVKIEYIKSDDFLAQNAIEKILSESVELPSVFKNKKIDINSPVAKGLPKYFDLIRNVPTLNRQQEMELFRRYNFLKYLADNGRGKLDLAKPSGTDIRKTRQYLNEAQKVQEVLIQANLRLVVRIATRHAAVANMGDLVGEGNIALMRAVEKFDYTKGFRFSTFASWVITKEFARHIPTEVSRLDKTSSTDMDDMEYSPNLSAEDIETIESTNRSLEEVMGDNLSEREQYIVRHHFGLMSTMAKKKNKTLKQIGDELGLSKERIRQIELSALQKLRRILTSKEFEMFKR